MTNRMLETLSSYVPNLLLKRTQEDPTPISNASAFRNNACVLFADISGFTQITEQLVEQGPEGVERLSALLNDYFGRLIEVVHSNGGDVFKFAGDALTAVWPVSSDIQTMADAAHHAAYCALKVQETLKHYRAPNGQTLSLKIGLGTGELLTINLGGQLKRWEFFLTGTPMEQAGLAESLAGPGQIVLSPDTWKLVKDKANGARRGDGHVILERIHASDRHSLPKIILEEGSERAIQAFIPGAILQRLSAGQEDWLSELRRVTVIFVNLPEINSETPLELGQAIMKSLQQDLYKYEGSVNSVSVDEKGVTLVGALGLHPFAHENDPERGTLAAMDMLKSLEKLGITGTIGVTTGHAFCGVIGNAARREYTMMGNLMNRAARLMKASAEVVPEKPILCDISTFEMAQHKIAFRGLDALELKGFQDRVPIYQPMAEKATAERARVSMVGREKERFQIAEYLQALLRHTCTTLIIEGDAGIGKSRLIDDLIRQADLLGIRWFIGAGDAVEKTTNYFSWRSVFSDLFDIDLAAAASANITALKESFAPLMKDRDLLPLLNPVLPFTIEETDFTRQMTGQVRANNTTTLLVDILQAALHEKPGVIIIEDAHWLDSASWALLRAVQRDVTPLMLVVAYRPAETAVFPDLEAVRAHSETQLIRLDTLSRDMIEALVRQRLGVSRLGPEIARFIHERAEGHPFFSEELAYALREAGLIEINNDVAGLSKGWTTLENIGFPETIQGVITSRIDRLSPQEQFTLKIASVIGRVFTYKALYDIHPIQEDRPQLHEILEMLELLDITPQETPEPNLSYIFKHIITQEVSYNLMSFSQRRQLHQMLGEYFETRFKANLEDYYALLAHHWSQAENEEKAVEYLDKAGVQALRNFANDEAIQFFETLLKWTGKNPEIYDTKVLARWHRLLGVALQAAGLFKESIEHLDNAAALIGKPVPRKRRFLIPRILFGIVVQAFKQSWRAPLPVSAKAENTDEYELLIEMSRIYDELAVMYFLSDDVMRMAFVDLEMINVAEKIGVTKELARTFNTVGVMAGVARLHRIGEAFHHRAVEAAEQLHHLPTSIRIGLGRGIYWIGLGQWQKVDEIVSEAQETANRIGDQRQYGEATVILAMNSVLTGEIDIGLARYQDLEQHARRVNNPIQIAWALDGQALVHLIRGQFSSAQKLINQATEMATGEVDHTAIIYNTAYAAHAAWHLGEKKEAAALVDQALDYLDRSMPLVYSLLFGLRWICEASFNLWQELKDEGSEHRLQRAIRFGKGFQRSFPISRPGMLRLEAAHDWQRGKYTRALKGWQRSLAEATALNLPIDMAESHLAIGQHAVGELRTHHLAEAKAQFESLFIDAGDFSQSDGLRDAGQFENNFQS